MHDMSVYHAYLTTVDQFGTCQLYLKIFTWPMHSQFPLLKDIYLIYIYLILPLSICIFYMMYWCAFFSLHPPFADTEVLPTTTTGSTSVGLAQVPSNGSHGALGLPGATGRQLLWPWRSWIASCSNLKLENVPALQLIYFHNLPQFCSQNTPGLPLPFSGADSLIRFDWIFCFLLSPGARQFGLARPGLPRCCTRNWAQALLRLRKSSKWCVSI